MVLFLFSIGVTKGKWGTLVNALLDFKRTTTPTRRSASLPELVAGRARPLRRRWACSDLGDEMCAHMRKSRMGHWQAQAFARLPTPVMTPRRAFQR